MPDTVIRAIWDGHALIPDGNYARALVTERLGEGEVTQIDLEPERSKASHNHAFAFVGIAWQNLPEHLVDAPFAKSPDHLRRHALIATGFCDTTMMACGDENRADRMAALVQRVAENLKGYAVVEVKGAIVICHTPMSQSYKAMGREVFQKSKTAILDWMAALIGVSSDDLAKMGKKEAA